MTENCRRFGTPGIEAIIGDFLSVDLSALEAPDAIFIGGHGGKLVEILMVVSKKMKENGVIVFNSVSDESKALLEEAVRQTGLRISAQTRITIDDFNTITVNVIYKL
jgi:precorrin-6Y C5,15-methyltransferase (decarboxylating)